MAIKTGIGTAYSAASRLWFTIWNGIVTELYSPTVDRPQIRDLQFLISDVETFLHQEFKDLQSEIKRVDQVLAYKIQEQDPDGRYTLDKVILADPHQPCLLIQTRVQARADVAERLKLYVLCAPHIEAGGQHNSGYVLELTGGRRVLVARKDDVWMALMTTLPFTKTSAGYVGTSDGYTDLSNGYQMKWEFDRAEDGKVALIREIPLSGVSQFTLGVAFGNTLPRALTTLQQALAVPFAQHRTRYAEQWKRDIDASEAIKDPQGNQGGTAITP